MKVNTHTWLEFALRHLKYKNVLHLMYTPYHSCVTPPPSRFTLQVNYLSIFNHLRFLEATAFARRCGAIVNRHVGVTITTHASSPQSVFDEAYIASFGTTDDMLHSLWSKVRIFVLAHKSLYMYNVDPCLSRPTEKSIMRERGPHMDRWKNEQCVVPLPYA